MTRALQKYTPFDIDEHDVSLWFTISCKARSSMKWPRIYILISTIGFCPDVSSSVRKYVTPSPMTTHLKYLLTVERWAWILISASPVNIDFFSTHISASIRNTWPDMIDQIISIQESHSKMWSGNRRFACWSKRRTKLATNATAIVQTCDTPWRWQKKWYCWLKFDISYHLVSRIIYIVLKMSSVVKWTNKQTKQV